MKKNNSFSKRNSKKKDLTLFCSNDSFKIKDDKSKKALKQKFACVVGKVIWLIIEKIIENLF